MKEDIDFIKIIKVNKILGVLNLNNMIPIQESNVKLLKYKEIEQYRIFNSEKEKRLYISFLNQELSLINQNLDKIKKSAQKLYNIKISNPNSRIARRSCDFRKLEKISELYNKKKSP